MSCKHIPFGRSSAILPTQLECLVITLGLQCQSVSRQGDDHYKEDDHDRQPERVIAHGTAQNSVGGYAREEADHHDPKITSFTQVLEALYGIERLVQTDGGVAQSMKSVENPARNFSTSAAKRRSCSFRLAAAACAACLAVAMPMRALRTSAAT